MTARTFSQRHGGRQTHLPRLPVTAEGFVVLLARTILGWTLPAVLCCMFGCCGSRQYWNDPPPPSSCSGGMPSPADIADLCGHGCPASESELQQRRQQYAATRDPHLAFELAEGYVQLAMAAEQAQPATCPDLYDQAASFSWICLRDGASAVGSVFTSPAFPGHPLPETRTVI